MRIVAATRTAELFSATTLLVLLGSAWITGQAGLSFALGGFLAGTLLAGTEYRHQVATDMAPYEGILLGLFFMVVGMAVDLPLVVTHIGTIVLLLVYVLPQFTPIFRQAGAKLPTATTMIQKPDRIASQTDASRQVGDGDATIKPTADAKPISTNEVAAATIAPAIPGPQWM